jgi:nucleoside-diphosphate-sugar epimerase
LNEETNGQAFFAVGDQQLSVSQISEKIVKNIGGKINYIPWPKDSSVIEVGDAVISNLKMKSLLKFNSFTNFEEGLCKTKEYFISCLNNYL